MPPSILLARLRLRWHRRAVASWLVVVTSAAAIGYFGAQATARPPRQPPRPVPSTAAGRPTPPSAPTSTAVASLAARLPPGFRGVSVPVPEAAPELHPGDLVDLVASTSASSLPDVVAEGVEVVDVRPGAITVAVRKERAPAVAAAVTSASVTVLLVGSDD